MTYELGPDQRRAVRWALRFALVNCNKLKVDPSMRDVAQKVLKDLDDHDKKTGSDEGLRQADLAYLVKHGSKLVENINNELYVRVDFLKIMPNTACTIDVVGSYQGTDVAQLSEFQQIAVPLGSYVRYGPLKCLIQLNPTLT